MIQATSLEAFLFIQRSLNNLEWTVLKAIRSQPNVTDAEINHMLGWNAINRVTPRRGALVEKGLVEEACKRKCRVGRREVIAWRAVPMPDAFEKPEEKSVEENKQQQLL